MTFFFKAICAHPIRYYGLLSVSLFLASTSTSAFTLGFWGRYLLFAVVLWGAIQFYYRIVVYTLMKRSYDIALNPALKRMFISLSVMFCAYLPVCLALGIRGGLMGFVLLLGLVVVYFFSVAHRMQKRFGFSFEYVGVALFMGVVLMFLGPLLFLMSWGLLL